MHIAAYIAISLLVVFGVWYLYWSNEARKLLKDSYLPPRPSPISKTINQATSRFLANKCVGPVVATGLENIPEDVSVFLLPNHQFEMDFAVLATAIPFNMHDYRTIATTSELRGLQGILGAFGGVFGVNNDRKNKDHKTDEERAEAHRLGECAKASSVKALTGTKTSRFLSFPQNRLERARGEIKTMKTGWMEILDRANKVQKTVAIPIAIDYKRDPAEATCKGRIFKTRLDGTFTTYGAAVAFGKPISSEDLIRDKDGNLDKDANTEMLKKLILEQFEIARAMEIPGKKIASRKTASVTGS